MFHSSFDIKIDLFQLYFYIISKIGFDHIHQKYVQFVLYTCYVRDHTCNHGNRYKWASTRENTPLGFVNNKGADQPAHTRSLNSVFVIHVLESTISKLATSEISIF